MLCSLLFFKATNPILRTPPSWLHLTLLPSQRPYFHIPSTWIWGLNFQYELWGTYSNLNNKHLQFFLMPKWLSLQRPLCFCNVVVYAYVSPKNCLQVLPCVKCACFADERFWTKTKLTTRWSDPIWPLEQRRMGTENKTEVQVSHPRVSVTKRNHRPPCWSELHFELFTMFQVLFCYPKSWLKCSGGTDLSLSS